MKLTEPADRVRIGLHTHGEQNGIQYFVSNQVGMNKKGNSRLRADAAR
jgi:hypothetical protein